MNIFGKLSQPLCRFLQIHVFYRIRAPKALIAFLQFSLSFTPIRKSRKKKKKKKKKKKTHGSENSQFCKIRLSRIGGQGHFDIVDKCFQTSFRKIAKLGTH